MKRRLFLASTMLLPAVGLLVRACPARAAEHEVQMLNKGPDGQRNWFEPAVLHAQSGDTIHFVPIDKGHNSAAVVVPDGAEAWQGKLSKELSVTLDVPGLYAYKCTPHFGLGMVGLVVVGDPSVNLQAVKSGRYPGKARTVMAELLEEVEAST
ncbi:MAG: pseudoazurin [Geminicoccaceae bacterium]